LAVPLTAQLHCKLRRIEDNPPYLSIKPQSHPAAYRSMTATDTTQALTQIGRSVNITPCNIAWSSCDCSRKNKSRDHRHEDHSSSKTSHRDSIGMVDFITVVDRR